MRISGAKNAMNRAIQDLLCRPLTTKEKNLVWEYFKSRCAYCDKRINRAHRHGHMDHLDCSATGGGNAIHNRVLACKECNGNEKREQNWKRFLKSKCKDAETFQHRLDNIKVWQKQCPKPIATVLSTQAEKAKLAVEEAVKNFEEKFVHLRTLIRLPQ
jgi:hypothetical protein